ncbi:hypothetical protein BDZ89DRAFT_1245136 [Hymenopellis radicata]|nr:hypothetical protein BDZ89DRAFT_1245136 [Hymenopellis radicata]
MTSQLSAYTTVTSLHGSIRSRALAFTRRQLTLGDLDDHTSPRVTLTRGLRRDILQLRFDLNSLLWSSSHILHQGSDDIDLSSPSVLLSMSHDSFDALNRDWTDFQLQVRAAHEFITHAINAIHPSSSCTMSIQETASPETSEPASHFITGTVISKPYILDSSESLLQSHTNSSFASSGKDPPSITRTNRSPVTDHCHSVRGRGLPRRRSLREDSDMLGTSFSSFKPALHLGTSLVVPKPYNDNASESFTSEKSLRRTSLPPSGHYNMSSRSNCMVDAAHCSSMQPRDEHSRSLLLVCSEMSMPVPSCRCGQHYYVPRLPFRGSQDRSHNVAEHVNRVDSKTESTCTRNKKTICLAEVPMPILTGLVSSENACLQLRQFRRHEIGLTYTHQKCQAFIDVNALTLSSGDSTSNPTQFPSSVNTDGCWSKATTKGLVQQVSRMATVTKRMVSTNVCEEKVVRAVEAVPEFGVPCRTVEDLDLRRGHRSGSKTGQRNTHRVSFRIIKPHGSFTISSLSSLLQRVQLIRLAGMNEIFQHVQKNIVSCTSGPRKHASVRSQLIDFGSSWTSASSDARTARSDGDERVHDVDKVVAKRRKDSTATKPAVFFASQTLSFLGVLSTRMTSSKNIHLCNDKRQTVSSISSVLIYMWISHGLILRIILASHDERVRGQYRQHLDQDKSACIAHICQTKHSSTVTSLISVQDRQHNAGGLTRDPSFSRTLEYCLMDAGRTSVRHQRRRTTAYSYITKSSRPTADAIIQGDAGVAKTVVIRVVEDLVLRELGTQSLIFADPDLIWSKVEQQIVTKTTNTRLGVFQPVAVSLRAPMSSGFSTVSGRYRMQPQFYGTTEEIITKDTVNELGVSCLAVVNLGHRVVEDPNLKTSQDSQSCGFGMSLTHTHQESHFIMGIDATTVLSEKTRSGTEVILGVPQSGEKSCGKEGPETVAVCANSTSVQAAGGVPEYGSPCRAVEDSGPDEDEQIRDMMVVRRKCYGTATIASEPVYLPNIVLLALSALVQGIYFALLISGDKLGVITMDLTNYTRRILDSLTVIIITIDHQRVVLASRDKSVGGLYQGNRQRKSAFVTLTLRTKHPSTIVLFFSTKYYWCNPGGPLRDPSSSSKLQKGRRSTCHKRQRTREYLFVRQWSNMDPDSRLTETRCFDGSGTVAVRARAPPGLPLNVQAHTVEDPDLETSQSRRFRTSRKKTYQTMLSSIAVTDGRAHLASRVAEKTAAIAGAGTTAPTFSAKPSGDLVRGPSSLRPKARTLEATAMTVDIATTNAVLEFDVPRRTVEDLDPIAGKVEQENSMRHEKTYRNSVSNISLHSSEVISLVSFAILEHSRGDESKQDDLHRIQRSRCYSQRKATFVSIQPFETESFMTDTGPNLEESRPGRKGPIRGHGKVVDASPVMRMLTTNAVLIRFLCRASEDLDLGYGQCKKTRPRTTHRFGAQDSKAQRAPTKLSLPSFPGRVRFDFDGGTNEDLQRQRNYTSSWTFHQRKLVPMRLQPIGCESSRLKTSPDARTAFQSNRERVVEEAVIIVERKEVCTATVRPKLMSKAVLFASSLPVQVRYFRTLNFGQELHEIEIYSSNCKQRILDSIPVTKIDIHCPRVILVSHNEDVGGHIQGYFHQDISIFVVLVPPTKHPATTPALLLIKCRKHDPGGLMPDPSLNSESGYYLYKNVGLVFHKRRRTRAYLCVRQWSNGQRVVLSSRDEGVGGLHQGNRQRTSAFITLVPQVKHPSMAFILSSTGIPDTLTTDAPAFGDLRRVLGENSGLDKPKTSSGAKGLTPGEKGLDTATVRRKLEGVTAAVRVVKFVLGRQALAPIEVDHGFRIAEDLDLGSGQCFEFTRTRRTHQEWIHLSRAVREARETTPAYNAGNMSILPDPRMLRRVSDAKLSMRVVRRTNVNDLTVVREEAWRTTLAVGFEGRLASRGFASGLGAGKDSNLKTSQPHRFTTSHRNMRRSSLLSLLQRVQESFEDPITNEKIQCTPKEKSLQFLLKQRSGSTPSKTVEFGSSNIDTSSVARIQLHAKEGQISAYFIVWSRDLIITISANADTFVLPVEYTCRTVPSSEAASRITPYSHNGISTSSAPEVGSVNTVGVVRGMVAIRSRVSSRRYPMLESWSSAWSRRQQHLVAETAAMPGTKPKTEDAPHSLPDNRQRGRADNRRALWVVVVVEEEDWSTAVLADSATSSSQILQPAGVTIIVVKDLQPHSRAYASCGAVGALKARISTKKGRKSGRLQRKDAWKTHVPWSSRRRPGVVRWWWFEREIAHQKVSRSPLG